MRRSKKRCATLLTLVGLLAACGGTVTDDGGTPDSGAVGTDSGTADAWVASDASEADAEPVDSGSADAAEPMPDSMTTGGGVHLVVNLSGGGAVVTGSGRTLALSVGHPQPMAERSTERYQLRLGPIQTSTNQEGSR